MAAGSLIIALTPGFVTIGYLAPILFVIARIMQGISAGSEQQSAITFMVEHAPPNRRGLFGSFTNMASGLATLAATGSAAIVTTVFDAETLANWGWRIPFLVGGILGLVGLFLRANADETPEFEAASIVDKKSAPARLMALLKEHPKALLQTAALSAPAVAYYTWATFLPTYASLTTGRNTSSTLTGSVIGLILLVITVPICGALSDRLGRRKIFPIVGAIGMIVLFYPLLLLLNQEGFWVYVVVAASGWLVLGIWQSVYPTIQAELFPAAVRVSGIGFSHQLVIAIFGGTAPLVAAAFVGAGHPMWVAIYMIVIVFLCLLVYFTLPETGSKTQRATVGLHDREVIEGELEEAGRREPHRTPPAHNPSTTTEIDNSPDPPPGRSTSVWSTGQRGPDRRCLAPGPLRKHRGDPRATHRRSGLASSGRDTRSRRGSGRPSRCTTRPARRPLQSLKESEPPMANTND